MRAQLSIALGQICWQNLKAEEYFKHVCLWASTSRQYRVKSSDLHKSLFISEAHLVTYIPLPHFCGFCSMFILHWILLYALNTADNQIIQIPVYGTQYTFYYYSWYVLLQKASCSFHKFSSFNPHENFIKIGILPWFYRWGKQVQPS